MSVTEVNNVQTTANKPGYLKRARMVCSPIVPGIIRFGKSLVDGQNIYDAAKTVKQEYKAVHEANKQDLHKAAEFTKKSPFRFGLLGQSIIVIDSIFNK